MANQNAKQRPSTEEAIHFFETVQHSLSNILPKPFRTIGLVSVDEYMHYMNEAKLTDENKDQAAETSANMLMDEKEIVSSEQQEGLYVTNLLTSGFELLYSYFHPANPQASVETIVDKAEEEKEEPLPQKEQRYDHSFISALKLFDEVWLIDSTNRTKKEYIQLRRELEAQRIVVGERCFISESNEFSHVIPILLQQLDKENADRSHKYFCVTAQAEIQLPAGICPVTLQPEQNETYYQKIIDTYTALDVQEEYQTIKVRLAPLVSKHDFVKNILENFDKHFAEGTLSLDYLKSGLMQISNKLTGLEERKSSLESSMHSPVTFFSKLSHKKSQSEQLMLQIDSQLDEWISSYHM